MLFNLLAFLVHSLDFIGKLDLDKQSVHPRLREDDSAHDLANLLIWNFTRYRAAAVNAGPCASGAPVLSIVLPSTLVGLRPHGYEAVGASDETFEKIFAFRTRV